MHTGFRSFSIAADNWSFYDSIFALVEANLRVHSAHTPSKARCPNYANSRLSYSVRQATITKTETCSQPWPRSCEDTPCSRYSACFMERAHGIPRILATLRRSGIFCPCSSTFARFRWMLQETCLSGLADCLSRDPVVALDVRVPEGGSWEVDWAIRISMI